MILALPPPAQRNLRATQPTGVRIASIMIRTIKDRSGRDDHTGRLTIGSLLYQQASRQLASRLSCYPSFGRYTMTICHAKKFIWFRVAKVGTRTIFYILKTSGVYLDAAYAPLCHYPKLKYQDYFKFAFVRNPYDRLVSCWRDKVVKANFFEFSAERLRAMQKIENFVDFVAAQNLATCNEHIRLQSKLIDLNNLDYLGRHENFEKDLAHVFNIVQVDFAAIPKKNSTNSTGEDYRTYYGGDLRAKVAKMYAQDLNLFAYDF